MATKTYTTANAHRNLARIERKADLRAREIAEWVVRRIAILAPRDPLHEEHTGGPRLAESYRVKRDSSTGDWVISSSRRYWVFVEFGTAEHGGPQPHVRPALDEAKALFR